MDVPVARPAAKAVIDLAAEDLGYADDQPQVRDEQSGGGAVIAGGGVEHREVGETGPAGAADEKDSQ